MFLERLCDPDALPQAKPDRLAMAMRGVPKKSLTTRGVIQREFVALRPAFPAQAPRQAGPQAWRVLARISGEQQEVAGAIRQHGGQDEKQNAQQRIGIDMLVVVDALLAAFARTWEIGCM